MNHKLINTNPDLQHFVFKANKNFPNSKLPLLIYKNCCLPGKQRNKAIQSIQKLFHINNWKNSWSNGNYTFHHYHSNTHECLGIVSGKAWVIFGGVGGKRYKEFPIAYQKSNLLYQKQQNGWRRWVVIWEEKSMAHLGLKTVWLG